MCGRRGNAMAFLQIGSVPMPFAILSCRRPSQRASRAATTRWSILALVALALTLAAPGPARAASPEGQLTWGVHVSLAPLWFDPAETPGIITPFMVMYALHDAMVKPMPGKPFAPSLAEVVDRVPRRAHLRVRPARGRQVPQRRAGYGRGREVLVRALSRRRRPRRSRTGSPSVETPDPKRVRFKLKQPWPDFLTFYASATGAAWVVPKKYVEQVGDEGFKKAPIGAGPLQVRRVHAGPRADVRGLRAVLAQEAQRQAPGVQGDPRRVDATGRAQAGRDRHRLLDPRRACRGAAAHQGAHASSPPSSRAHSGSTSPTNGTRSRRGTISACDWRPASPSTARPSTRP